MIYLFHINIGKCDLWQDAPDTADARTLQRFFESFCDSCDWWLDRVGEFSAPPPEIPPMMIRP